MKKALVVVSIVSCCALFALSLAEDNLVPPGTVKPSSNFTDPTEPPKPTPPKPTPPKPTTPKPTTPKPTTPKPTTPKPTTPKPTTPKPTTPKPTTPKPTTPKTTIPPTTAPSPSPDVPVGHYNLTTDKQVCVMAKIGLKIRLTSPKNNGTFTVQPNMTTAKGECKDPNANLTLVFPQGFITFLFSKNVTAKNVFVKSVNFELNYPLVKGAGTTYKATNDSKRFFARIGHAYSCREESINMGGGLYLDVTKDNIQAFNFSKSNEFGSPDACPADQPNYSVAIAVGVTLLVLIIIVVVAYLVGRRRRSDGYQSL